MWLGPSPTMLALCTRFRIRYTGQRRNRRTRRLETPIMEVFYAGLSFQRRVQETNKKKKHIYEQVGMIVLVSGEMVVKARS